MRIKYQIRLTGDKNMVLCTDGEFHDSSTFTFGCGKVPKGYKSPAGAAAKQRALDHSTFVERVEIP